MYSVIQDQQADMSHTLLAYSSSPKNRTTSNSPKHPLGLLPWKSLKSNIPSVLKKQYGSPSYPSPLDRIRTGRCERALQLGLTPPKDNYYHNQSLPCGIQYHLDKGNESPDMGDLRKSTLDKFKGDALNTFSFSHGCSKGSFARTSEKPHHRRSLSGSWVFYNFIGESQTGSTFPTSVQNPNKAIVTINAKTTEILVANKMAYELLGLPTSKLSRKKLSDFFITGKGQCSLTETELEASGELVLISGKVGIVLSSEKNMALFHGHVNPEELEGVSITYLIPSLVIPLLDLPNAKLPKTESEKTEDDKNEKDGKTEKEHSAKSDKKLESAGDEPPGTSSTSISSEEGTTIIQKINISLKKKTIGKIYLNPLLVFGTIVCHAFFVHCGYEWDSCGKKKILEGISQTGKVELLFRRAGKQFLCCAEEDTFHVVFGEEKSAMIFCSYEVNYRTEEEGGKKYQTFVDRGDVDQLLKFNNTWLKEKL